MSDEKTPPRSKSADDATDAEVLSSDAGRREAALRLEDAVDESFAERDDGRAASAAAPAKSGGVGFIGGLGIGVIGGLLGGAAMLFGGPALKEQAPGIFAVASENEVQSRFSEMAGRIEALETALAETRRQGGETAAEISAAVDTASGEREGLRQSIAQTAVEFQEAVANQTARLDGLETDLGAESTARTESVDNLDQKVSLLIDRVNRENATLAAIAGGDGGAADGGAASGGAAAAAAANLRDSLLLLETDLKALREKVADIQRGDATDEITAALTGLNGRVDALEVRAEQAVSGTAAIGVAFAALSRTLATSAPYASELATLTSVADVAAPDALASAAETGLPSRVALANRFEPAAQAALRAAQRATTTQGAEGAEEDGGIGSWISGAISAVATVETVGETEGDGPGAVISRARGRVAEGDLAAALAELATLPSAADEALAPWRADAEARVAAETALASLEARLIGAE